MLACARIGAVHSVVFAGFSAESLASRVEDCKSRVVVTTSGVMRGKKKLETKVIVDDALQISKREGFEVWPACQFVILKNVIGFQLFMLNICVPTQKCRLCKLMRLTVPNSFLIALPRSKIWQLKSVHTAAFAA